MKTQEETIIPELEDLERVLLEEGSQYERWEWRIKGTGIKHHPSEPAVQYKNGNWVWRWMGEEHRWDGPSSYWRGEYQYWIMDEQLTREEWENYPDRLEWLKNKAGEI